MFRANNSVAMEKYMLTRLLGQGSYGRVHQARHVDTGNLVAIKKYLLQPDQEGIHASILREISLLRELDHPNVMKLKQVIFQTGLKGEISIYLVLEYLEFDLHKLANKHFREGKLIPYQVTKDLVYQMLRGIQHCHENGIMHRDLKPENLLYDEESRLLKLADFGLGRLFSLPVERYSHEVMTINYRAPEILLGAGRYSTAVDMWSAGCVFAELLSGDMLFRGTAELEILLEIFKRRGTPTVETWPGVGYLRDWIPVFPKFPEVPFTNDMAWRASDAPECLSLLTKMLQLDPAKRITAEEALRSKFFDDIRGRYM